MENKFIEVSTKSDEKWLVNTTYIKKIQPWSDNETRLEMIDGVMIIIEPYEEIKKMVLVD